MHTTKILLEKYMQGGLSKEELQILRQQVGNMTDTELQNLLEELWNEHTNDDVIDETLKQRIWKNIAQETQGSASEDRQTEVKTVRMETPSSRFSVKRWLRVAAILLVLVVGCMILFQNRVEKPQLSEAVTAAIAQAEKSGKNQAAVTVNGKTIPVTNEKSLASSQKEGTHSFSTEGQERVLTTYHNSEFWMTLEDGTRVHLNYGSRLVYPIHFGGDTREVELQGEAYFFVAKDKDRPFIVHTPNGDVKQYGTEFNINTRDEIGVTRIVLVNGSIGVTAKGGKEFMMKPNDMAILQPGETEPMVSQVDITPYIAWNIGTFVFEDCTLEQLMRVLSHWYNKRVQFESEEIRQMRFTGEFDKYESIIPTMKAIHNVTGLRIEVHGKDIIISE